MCTIRHFIMCIIHNFITRIIHNFIMFIIHQFKMCIIHHFTMCIIHHFSVYYSSLQNVYYSPLHSVYYSPLQIVYYSPAFRRVCLPPACPIKTAPHAATAQLLHGFLRSSVVGTFAKVCRNVPVLIKVTQRYLSWRSGCSLAYIESKCLTFVGARNCRAEVVDENDKRYKPKNFPLSQSLTDY
jgi:hypothetical protein